MGTVEAGNQTLGRLDAYVQTMLAFISLLPTPMRYVDAFVLVLPKKNINAYKKMAAAGGKIWKKHGALDYVETIGDDLRPDMGEMGGMKPLTFIKLTKLRKGEVPVFSYIVYKSKKHRDQVNAKVMKDPAMNSEKNKDMKMPFDIARMAYGGFNAIVDL